MEKEKHFWDYLAIFVQTFGTTILALTILTAMFGEGAKGYSTIYALGRTGIPLSAVWQFLLSSFCITVFRFLFFTDTVFKKLSIARRTVFMLISVVGLIGMFAYLFGWFPIDNPLCWVCFFACFAVCFVISAAVSSMKEKADNKRLADGLKVLKEEQGRGIY